MFYGGNVTVYVSNMDSAVRFYSDTLGLRLAYRFGDQFASVENLLCVMKPQLIEPFMRCCSTPVRELPLQLSQA